jgi:hypothetical protein
LPRLPTWTAAGRAENVMDGEKANPSLGWGGVGWPNQKMPGLCSRQGGTWRRNIDTPVGALGQLAEVGEDQETVARAQVLKFGFDNHPGELDSPQQTGTHLLLGLPSPRSLQPLYALVGTWPFPKPCRAQALFS